MDGSNTILSYWGCLFSGANWLLVSGRVFHEKTWVVYTAPFLPPKVKYTLTELVAEATNVEHMEEDTKGGWKVNFFFLTMVNHH